MQTVKISIWMQWLSIKEEDLLIREIPNAEEMRQLTTLQHQVLLNKKLYLLYLPAELGGLSAELPEAIHFLEKLACLDGSVGWTTTLCSGAAWFAGFMNDELLKHVFSNPEQVCIGGSGMDTGVAIPVGNEQYRLDGFWKYATGTPHLTAFTLNCQRGNELISACLSKDQVQIVKEWRTMGLKATASHSFSVHNALLSSDCFFRIDQKHIQIDMPIFRIPFLQFAELTLAANYLGMFRKFRQLHPKLDEQVWVGFDEKVPRYYSLVDRCWSEVSHNVDVAEDLQLEISSICRELVHLGLLNVAKCYPSTGMLGAHEESTINRVWRDLFTASQHQAFR